jgi:hypothetical protein
VVAADRTATNAASRRRSPPPPPRRIEELDEPGIIFDQAYRVAGARVVFADYDLLRADFPGLSTDCLARHHPDLKGMPEPQRETRAREIIDAWLVHNGGLISVTQAGQSLVNTPISCLSDPVEVYRLPQGGRVFFTQVSAEPVTPGETAEGLLDLKGVGVRPAAVPSFERHWDGLIALRYAFEDFILQLIIDTIFRHAGVDFHTLPVYAILDPGFDVLREARSPAGILVRRANRRRLGKVDFPPHGTAEHGLQLKIELLLRKYGMTSVNPGTVFELSRDSEGTVTLLQGGRIYPWGGAPQDRLQKLWKAVGRDGEGTLRFDGVNIQLTRTLPAEPPQLVDFGHFRIMSRFVHPLLTQVQDRPFFWGGILYPDHPRFVQPLPGLAISNAPWDEAEDRTAEEEAEGRALTGGTRLNSVDLLCARLATGFREGRISGSEVRAALGGLVETITSHLR